MERLDKLLASQGMLSRREVKELITKGRVTIDGTVEKHPERKVTGEEQIVVAGELLRVQRTLTLMLHKPQGVVSAAREGRYHQIKRMFGCCGATVTGLHRLSMGALRLDDTLAPGECRPLSEEEISLLRQQRLPE